VPNTSATGGYLAPSLTTPPLYDQAFRRLLQAVFVGITSLPGKFVRPAWQQNPPPMPEIDVDWMAFGITDYRPDANEYQGETTAPATQMQRHEDVDVLCTFYGPNCTATAATLRDGLHIGQNRTELASEGMGLVGVSDIIHAPELINDRYFERCDMTVTIRREVLRTYPILSLLGAYGQVIANSAGEHTTTTDWTAGAQYVPPAP
jgi:hypothetical protein